MRSRGAGQAALSSLVAEQSGEAVRCVAAVHSFAHGNHLLEAGMQAKAETCVQLVHELAGLGISACVSALLSAVATVGSDCPSACHGCAVACIGQPPPPSALGPMWWVMVGWAVLPRLRWLGVLRPGVARLLALVSSRGGAGADVLKLNLMALHVSRLGLHCMTSHCADPLRHSGSAHPPVRLYW